MAKSWVPRRSSGHCTVGDVITSSQHTLNVLWVSACVCTRVCVCAPGSVCGRIERAPTDAWRVASRRRTSYRGSVKFLGILPIRRRKREPVLGISACHRVLKESWHDPTGSRKCSRTLTFKNSCLARFQPGELHHPQTVHKRRREAVR